MEVFLTYMAIDWRARPEGLLAGFDQKTEKFHCPCHGSIFDVHGNRLAGPARRPLSRIPIEFDKDGNVLVKVRRTA